MSRPIVVRADWDDEAQVWVATSEDVQGLATEADTIESLRQRLRVIIADLLEDEFPGNTEFELELIAYAHERLKLAS